MAELKLLRMGDHVDLLRSVVAMVTLAVGFNMVAGAPAAAMEPGASGEDGGGSYCVRPLVHVIWGFLLTLLALFISLWGSVQYSDHGYFDRALTVLAAVLAPLVDLRLIIKGSCRCILMLWKYHKQENLGSSSMQLFKKLSFSVLPRSKNPLRILATCDIVMYVRTESRLRQTPNLNTDDAKHVIDESEAMVIGDPVVLKASPGMKYCKIELSPKLVVALALAKVLPDYNQLKFLRGNSGLAAVTIALQAVGYIYAVLFRSFKLGKPVAPVEVLGLILNLIILIKISLFSICNPCHRPLVIYMNQVQEYNLLCKLDAAEEPCKEIQVPNFDKLACRIVCVIAACLEIVLIYFTVRVMKGTGVVVIMPLIIFAVTIILEFIFHFFSFPTPVFEWNPNFGGFLIFLIFVLNLVGYIWAIVVTFRRWKSQHFNAQGLVELLDYSQLLPFVG